MLRPVRLPAHVRGSLLLYSMPGRFEPLELVWEHVRADGVQVIVNLAQPAEIQGYAPAYARALQNGQVPCPVISFPVQNHGIPGSREAFWELAFNLAQRLEAADRILVHCAAGVGRSGSLATCVLAALGEKPAVAAKAVRAADAQPGTRRPRGLVAWCAARRGVAG